MNKNTNFVLTVSACLVLVAGAAMASDSLDEISKDPNQWVMPSGDYAATRHSKLDQINVNNVKHLQFASTISTGTLRGH